jgi:hypothetical protein
MRLTLDILKKLNDFEFVLEIMGDYTGTDASLGPAHNIGEAHVTRPREQVQESITSENPIVAEKSKSKTRRTVVCTLAAVVIATVLSGFIVSGGLLPNANKGTVPVSTAHMSVVGMVSGHVTGPSALPALGASVIAHKIEGLPGTDQRLPDYTTNSMISVDGKYVFSLPPGVYRFIVAFPDGTNHVINDYAVWPGSSHALDFKY